jgi:activator of 2-hydroxyglutaryl-CoA dehydratase
MVYSNVGIDIGSTTAKLVITRDGQVLFNSGINRTGNQLVHFFTAAYQGYAGVVDLGYNVAAVLADIELDFFHGFSS